MLKKDNNISYYEYFQVLLSNKTNLFLALSIAFLSIVVYPLILPHLAHPSMIYHIVVHIISFDVALFLTFISALSYKKTKSKKSIAYLNKFWCFIGGRIAVFIAGKQYSWGVSHTFY